MGYNDGATMAMWQLAQQFTLADNFFMGAFGGSFLNHQYLICACAPEFPNADIDPAHPTIAVLDPDGSGGALPSLTLAAASPASAIDGTPVFTLSGNLVPKNYFGDGDVARGQHDAAAVSAELQRAGGRPTRAHLFADRDEADHAAAADRR